jgi:hypothetical protein
MEHTNDESVLDAIDTFLGRFISYPSTAARHAHVLWIAHTWLMDAWESTPRIAFMSPEPGSGKSRALEVTEWLVPRSIHAVNTTPAYLFRKVSDPDGRPTILYDEIDTVFGPAAKGNNEDIRGMLNAGHRKGAAAGRCTTRGNNIVTEELPAYCAVAIAGLKDLPDTIATRSVIVRMRKRAPDEYVEPWRARVNVPEAQQLGERINAWAASVAPTLGDYWPDMPAGVTDRAADVWEPLIAVADKAGGRWPEIARVAAVTLVTANLDKAASVGVQLLTDIKLVFDTTGKEKIATQDLLHHLNSFDESPWASANKGQPLNPRGLSSRLREYEISPMPLRVGEVVFKGYARAQFADAWKRYLSPIPEKSVTPATPVTPQVKGLRLVTGSDSVTDEELQPNARSGGKNSPISNATLVTDVTEFQSKAEDDCLGCSALLTTSESLTAGKCHECRAVEEMEATNF